MIKIKRFILRLKVFLIVLFAVTVGAILFTQTKDEEILWLSDFGFRGLYWDTGYGFNEFQYLPELDVNRKYGPPTGLPAFYAESFGRLFFVRAIRVRSVREDVRAFLQVGDDFREIPLTKTKDEDGFLYEANDLLTPGYFRSSEGWIFFCVGVFLWTSLLTAVYCLFHENAIRWRSSREARSRLLVASVTFIGLAVALILFYPGLTNFHDPPMILSVGQNYHFGVQYSFYLTAAWVALLEVIRAPISILYILTAVQLLGFAIALFYSAQRLLSFGWPSWAFGLLLATLLFFPPGFLGQFFLSRGIVAGGVNFLLWLEVFILLLARKRGVALSHFPAMLLIILSAALRLDFIPIALACAIVIYWGKPKAKFRLAGLAILVLFTAYLPFPLSGVPNPYREYLRENGEAILNGLGAPPEVPRAELEGESVPSIAGEFFHVVFTYPGEYFYRRWKYFRGLWINPYGLIGVKLSDAIENPDEVTRPMLNLRMLPSLNLYDLKSDGIERFKSLKIVAELSILQVKLPLLALIAAVLYFPLKSAGGAVALLGLLRVVQLLFFAPLIKFHYIYDLYLLGIFLVFAIAVDVWRNRKNRKMRFGLVDRVRS